jgi:hypothetical protein
LARLRWLFVLSITCLPLAGCNKFQHKKPDPTKGVVTGLVLCADTGKPARFATVTLSAAPKTGEKNDDQDPLPAAETTVTDLDGRFRIEAVQPAHYYAFATQEGYLDPALGIDPDKLSALGSDKERHLYAISAWKDHLADVSVGVHRISEVNLSIERAAEISGTVTFDDASPAIGMHFQLFRKTDKDAWASVGLPLLDTWTIHAESDGHGRFNLTNLPAGVYTVCALMPSDAEERAPRICYGNVFRKKLARPVKVASGETASGVDIDIPLSGMHTVSGIVSALTDGHAINHATLRLLYADDREPARQTDLLEDGTYSFEYVPEGNYILKVSGAADQEEKAADPGQGETQPGASQPEPGQPGTTQSVAVRTYVDKEVPITVSNDDEINLALEPPTPPAPQASPALPQSNPQ